MLPFRDYAMKFSMLEKLSQYGCRVVVVGVEKPATAHHKRSPVLQLYQA